MKNMKMEKQHENCFFRGVHVPAFFSRYYFSFGNQPFSLRNDQKNISSKFRSFDNFLRKSMKIQKTKIFEFQNFQNRKSKIFKSTSRDLLTFKSTRVFSYMAIFCIFSISQHDYQKKIRCVCIGHPCFLHFRTIYPGRSSYNCPFRSGRTDLMLALTLSMRPWALGIDNIEST